MDCLFCKIIKGDIPAKTVFEDSIVKVIMDVNPNSNGHILVLPKKHITDFEEMDEKTLAHIHMIAKMVKKWQYAALEPDGLVLHVNYGIAQQIKHYHLHLIPVYKNKQSLISVDEVYQKIMQKKTIN